MGSRLTWTIILVTIWSGCMGPGSTTGATLTTAPPPIVNPDLGAIAGRVTDDELVALPGVEIALVDSNAIVRSDDAGAFTINGVAPGTHTLAASRLGYESLTQRVTVEAGAATEVKISMRPLAIVEPHVESFVDDGYIALTISGPSFFYFGGLVEGSKTTFIRNATQGAVSVVTTGWWDQSTAATAKRLRLTLQTADTNNFTEGKPGLQVRADGMAVSNKEKITIVLYTAYTCDALAPTTCAEDPPNRVAQVAYQQKTKVYTHVFYVDPAPAGFTGLPA